MSILSHGNSFAEKILFYVLLLEKMPNGIEPFACSTAQKSNRSCILDVVAGDSLSRLEQHYDEPESVLGQKRLLQGERCAR
jgi:hypothetical protein